MAETALSDAPTPEPKQPAEKPAGIWSRLGLFFVRQREASILVVTLVLLIYFWISSSDIVSLPNIRTIFEYLSETAIIAVGEVFLLNIPRGRAQPLREVVLLECQDGGAIASSGQSQVST